MEHDMLQIRAGVATVVEDRPAVEIDHVEVDHRRQHALLGERHAPVQAEQVEGRFQFQLALGLLVGEILDMDDDAPHGPAEHGWDGLEARSAISSISSMVGAVPKGPRGCGFDIAGTYPRRAWTAEMGTRICPTRAGRRSSTAASAPTPWPASPAGTRWMAATPSPRPSSSPISTGPSASWPASP